MKKAAYILAFLALSSAPLFAQHGTPEGPPITTVSALGHYMVKGKVVVVTDGISATDCGVGGGSTTVPCIFSGSAWSAIGGSSGIPYPGLGIALSTGAAWNTSIASPDGDASHFLNGIGGWTAPAGGANTTLSNLTGPTAINVTTLTGAGAIGLTAGGTNQNITLTPSGTGVVSLPATGTAAGTGDAFGSFPLKLNASWFQGSVRSGSFSIYDTVNTSNYQYLYFVPNNSGTPGRNGYQFFGGDGAAGHFVVLDDASNNVLMTLSDGTNQARINPVSTGLSLAWHNNKSQVTGGVPIGNAQTVTFSATLSLDASLYNHFEIPITGNVTSFAITGGIQGEDVTIVWDQDGSAHTINGIDASIHGLTTPGSGASQYTRQVCSLMPSAVWVCGVANTNIP